MAVVICLVMAAVFSSCSGNYVMTEKDLALQNSLVGYWAAGNNTGYNTYDENGNIAVMLVVEFTEDFSYILYECHIDEGYVLSYDPINYTFEDEKFRVDVDGVPSYAAVTISEDGQSMYWITDEKTDRYERMEESGAIALGIPEHSGTDQTEQDTGSSVPESGSDTGTETGEDTEE